MQASPDTDKAARTAVGQDTMSWSKRRFTRPIVFAEVLTKSASEFGLMHITGERDGMPVKVGVAVTDLTTGLYTSNAVMAALIGRAKTGQGQHIDAALSDCQLATLANIASSTLVSGKRDSGRWGTAHRKEFLIFQITVDLFTEILIRH